MATRVASAALGQQKHVWWSADMAAAEYYGLPLTKTGRDRSAARVLMNPSVGDVRDEPLPDVAVLSKPEVYDQAGTLRSVLGEHGFKVSRQLQAFSIWERTRQEGDR